jgi:hypothetical protein
VIERRAGVGAELVEQRGQCRIAGQRHLAGEPLEQMPPPLAEVGNPRRHSVRVKRHPQHVDRGREQLRRDALGEQRDAAVAGDHLPFPVDDRGGIGLVAGQHLVERRPHRLHLGIVEPVLHVHRGVAGRQHQPVSFAERDVELVSELQHHLGARARAAGLDEAQVASRDSGLERQVELAQPAALAPVPQ